ncbi:MAG: hypothetical protein GF411_05615 [Candidatus Lokiarchaeota archaeon]|nr:hypothetical protein [Candidatus Lokiarchaeota archaeon]
MQLIQLLSPLTDFVNLITGYFIEIWDFLIFIGSVSAVMVVLSGAILWFTNFNEKKGKGLVFSGILLALVVEYFILYPPEFLI